MDPTIAYYDRNAEAYSAATLTVEMDDVRRAFLSLLPPHARILDVGCGSGRDMLAFLRAGHRPEGLEPSPKMAELAASATHRPVVCGRVEDLSAVEQFDGVWCCASLLHVPRAQLQFVFTKLFTALKPSGAGYVSFKLGQGERTDHERHFTDLQPPELAALVHESGGLVAECWTCPDHRPGNVQQWVNCTFTKRLSSPQVA